MSVENQEERALEVLNLPPNIDQELLVLYFENKRRSGGGPLVSVEKRGHRAIVVFEETEAAARVLSKEVHTLQNTDLRVRRAAGKDQRRLLLRGIRPSTSVDFVELYVENTLGLTLEEYELCFPPARDSVLIQLGQPLTQDFQTLSAKISQRLINGASLTLEEVEQTDSVLVRNLQPSTSPEMLSLYFESRGGAHAVMDVTKLSESTARVSFADYDSVDLVLAQPHKLKGADLEVRPYFDFLQPTAASDPQADSPEDTGDKEQSSHMAPEIPAETSQTAAAQGAEDLTEEVPLTDFISIADPVKLELFQLGNFQQKIKETHADVIIQVKDNGVHIEAADQQTFEQVKDSLLQYFCQMAETYFLVESEEAQFLDRTEVKARLQRSMCQTPATYMVLDSNVVVTALSCTSADQACSFVKSQLAHVSIAMDSQYKCIFPSSEWLQFLQALSLASVKVSTEDIDVLTLKGMESEMQTVVTEFLTSQIESEVVVCMEPDVLKYIQAHCHRLLVDMDQVSVIPLESLDVSGFKIYGHPVACSTAKEMLQGIVSSICTKTITVSSPGIARYLLEKDCTMFLSTMEEEFQVYITVNQQPWEPPAEQDFFHAAWAQMSTKNFNKVSVDVLKSVAEHNNQELLESAKKVITALDDGLLMDQTSANQRASSDDMDLYPTEEDEAPDATGAGILYTNESLSVEDEQLRSPEDLEEEATLSLAIQYSMDSNQRSMEEEEQLQKALMLSKEVNQYEMMESATDQLNEAISASLEEAVKASNTVQFHVFATNEASLQQVDIAFKKKVSQKQVVEKLDHRAAGDMTEYNKKCLEAIERKHGVEIQTEGTIINIFGFNKFVSQALYDVQLLLSRMLHSPSNQEILQKVQWVFYDPVSSSITPYSPDVIVFLENAWRMKMWKIEVLLDNQLHFINFREMQAHNTASGESVIISRESINTEVMDGNHTYRAGENSELKTLPSATKVDEDSNEFRLVAEAFNNSICEYKNKIQIVQVDRLENRLLYHQYQLKRMSIQQTSTQAEFEKTLYHGTSEESMKEICLHGFNRSFCGKNATVYGQGVYFAVNSAVSLNDQYSPPNADGHKFVFVSRVLTGDYTKGCSSMKAAPLKPGSDVPFRYDSVTNNMDNPKIFVIFSDTQAFPQYLITCKKN